MENEPYWIPVTVVFVKGNKLDNKRLDNSIPQCQKMNTHKSIDIQPLDLSIMNYDNLGFWGMSYLKLLVCQQN